MLNSTARTYTSWHAYCLIGNSSTVCPLLWRHKCNWCSILCIENNAAISSDQFTDEYQWVDQTRAVLTSYRNPYNQWRHTVPIRLLRIFISKQLSFTLDMANILQSPDNETCLVYKVHKLGRVRFRTDIMLAYSSYIMIRARSELSTRCHIRLWYDYTRNL